MCNEEVKRVQSFVIDTAGTDLSHFLYCQKSRMGQTAVSR